MPAPHPLAAVAQHLVRERHEPKRRRARRRPWWQRFVRTASTAPVTTAPAGTAPVPPPGLALPPTLVLPTQRVSQEQPDQAHSVHSA